jgi:signal peptidase I
VNPNEVHTTPDPNVTVVTDAQLNKTKPTPARSMLATLSTIALLLIAPLIALSLTLFVFQSYQVDGPSMQETLNNEDRLIVWKLPRSWSNLTGHQYVPNRGDVVILNEAGLDQFGSVDGDKKQLVKRVIGLPGDRIVIKEGIITVYNKQYPQGFRPDEELPYGATAEMTPTTNDLEVTIGPDELYVCGDNRANSMDSRMFGPIKTEQIVGKLVLRILPLNKMQRF